MAVVEDANSLDTTPRFTLEKVPGYYDPDAVEAGEWPAIIEGNFADPSDFGPVVPDPDPFVVTGYIVLIVTVVAIALASLIYLWLRAVRRR